MKYRLTISWQARAGTGHWARGNAACYGLMRPATKGWRKHYLRYLQWEQEKPFDPWEAPRLVTALQEAGLIVTRCELLTIVHDGTIETETKGGESAAVRQGP